MTPTNRLDSVPPNVLSGARIPNVIAGFGRPAMAAPSEHARRPSVASLSVVAAMLALGIGLLVALFGGRVP
jgi:hypothetical protein